MRLWLGLLSLWAACSGESGVEPDASPTPPSPPGIDSALAGDGPPDAGTTVMDGSTLPRFLCSDPRPAGAPVPDPPPPYTGGTCPQLVAGQNTILSTGHMRQFLLAVPSGLSPAEKLPVLFLWHWLGGSAQGFLERGEVQQAADQQRFFAVLPMSKGALLLGQFDLKWPFDITQSADRMNEEFAFFDDMLACVRAQFNVNADCVSTVGVSAGALFSAQLAQARSTRLSSFVSLSGGVGTGIIRPWSGAAHMLPAIVLWGGNGPPADGIRDFLGCLGIGMDFAAASAELESGLGRGGDFFVECVHNCGHVEPPLQAPPGESKYAGIWQFALDHPYWLRTGQSPYQSMGLPAGLPAWCGLGRGGATPRTGGGCPPPENPCSF